MEAIQIIKYEKTRKETKQNKQQCIDKVVWSSDKLNWSMLREICSTGLTDGGSSVDPMPSR